MVEPTRWGCSPAGPPRRPALSQDARRPGPVLRNSGAARSRTASRCCLLASRGYSEYFIDDDPRSRPSLTGGRAFLVLPGDFLARSSTITARCSSVADLDGDRSSAARGATSTRWWRLFATGSGSRRRFASPSAARPGRARDRSRTRVIRPGRDRHPLRPGARAARRPEPTERELLGALPYQANETVLHTDRSLMPRRRRAWGSWNFPQRRIGRPDDGHLRHEPPQRLHAGRRYVTLNRSAAIDPAQVIYRTTYDHPVHSSRASGPGTLGRDQRAQSHPLLRCLLGLGVSTAWSARCGPASGSGRWPRARDRGIRLPKELAA